MALWNGVRQLKSKLNLYACRYRIPNQGFCVANHRISSSILVPVFDVSNYVENSSALGFFSNVRFYAAPAKAKPKKQEKRSDEPKLNHQITTPFIRLVTDEGHSVVPLLEAMGRAKSLELDLVEVDSKAKPPVCKIMDYHKEKYLEQLRDKERAKNKTSLKSGAFKEVRFTAKINQSDLKMKADNVKRLLEGGFRVKCTAMERKNEPTKPGELEALLTRFLALIEDISILEGEVMGGKTLTTEKTGQKSEVKQAFIVVRHIRFGPVKGSRKKAPTNAIVEDANQTDNSEWAVSNEDDDIEDIEDIFDEANGPSNQEQPHYSSPSGPDKSDSYKQMVNPIHQMENRYARSNQPLDRAKGQQYDNAQSQRRPSQPSQAHNASSPSKGYGVFSSQRPTNEPAGHRPTVGEFNRYKKNESSEPSAGPPSSAGFRSHPSVNRGQRGENPGQGRWGGFSSGENSNVDERPAQNQRRS